MYVEPCDKWKSKLLGASEIQARENCLCSQCVAELQRLRPAKVEPFITTAYEAVTLQMLSRAAIKHRKVAEDFKEAMAPREICFWPWTQSWANQRYNEQLNELANLEAEADKHYRAYIDEKISILEKKDLNTPF